MPRGLVSRRAFPRSAWAKGSRILAAGQADMEPALAQRYLCFLAKVVRASLRLMIVVDDPYFGISHTASMEET
jgi:hypothetical protein